MVETLGPRGWLGAVRVVIGGGLEWVGWGIDKREEVQNVGLVKGLTLIRVSEDMEGAAEKMEADEENETMIRMKL